MGCSSRSSPACYFRRCSQRPFRNWKRAPLFSAVKADKTTPKYLWFFFCDDAAFFERKVLSKRALEVGNCPSHEILQFKSGQLLRNRHKNLWFKRRNPGSKKPGNGWCAWLCARRIYTGNSLCHVLIKKIHSQSIAPQGFAAFLWKFFKNPSLTSEPPTND